MNQEVKLKNTKIQDAFWSEQQRLVTDVVIPYQEQVLDDAIPNVEKSHAFANFRIAAGLEEGEYYGMVFQDSDVAKWLEAAAYSLSIKPDADLEARADAVIDVIEKAQQPDGYLNTYFTIKEPGRRWQNLMECHELYCAGHMMEAAAAYYEATGKDKLLRIMERMSDHIAGIFGPGPDQRPGIPGHEEVEIGLLRMYDVTKDKKYFNLAQYFIEERGQDPDFFLKETEKRGWIQHREDPENNRYTQSHAPVREQKTAEGHSVRAVYLYTAMADLAGKTEDKSLFDACETLWDNITEKRMYITGGIGSNVEGEAFTLDYDLPNDSVYAETCASIGLIFFAKKMLDICPSRKYGDVMERALYNGVISGMQRDGKRFFYVNPLEVNPSISGELFGFKHVLPQRPGWYACSCCPPNVARLLSSLGKYVWSESPDTVYSHLFIGGTADTKLAKIEMESSYPNEGKICYKLSPKTDEAFSLSIRIPGFVKKADIQVGGAPAEYTEKNGYIYISRKWSEGDEVTISFDIPIQRMRTNTAVRSNIDQIALVRGPFVYCLEGADNQEPLQELHVARSGDIEVDYCDEEMLKGLPLLKVPGARRTISGELYTEELPEQRPADMTAIPYFTWGNRGLNQMRVWLPEC